MAIIPMMFSSSEAKDRSDVVVAAASALLACQLSASAAVALLCSPLWQVYQARYNVWKRTINVAKSLKFLSSRKVHLNFISSA